ncbi:hypothetical protein D8674_029520 [Pyrus ussuriensis x Pyrus communis]|uniref:Uncharacterized protein n=1 Tax=Pyrus ussuriensis x Pyrus communis TaxID=2448454 RepID=A0A5N5I2B5_9ROSA|nr:hypothetical protein D8674_029520 [Pyrus ussuriensis x Pyrus communis]
MASNYTTSVAPSPPRPESQTHRLAAAKFNFNNGRPKTTSPNPIPTIGLITGLFSTGKPCADLFFIVIKPEKVSPAEVEATRMYLKQLQPAAPRLNIHLSSVYIAVIKFELMDALNKMVKSLQEDKWIMGALNKNFRPPLEGSLRTPIFSRPALIAAMAIERYERDPNYKLLHDRVTDVYVEHLKSDIKILKQKLMQSDIDEDDRCCLGFEITDAKFYPHHQCHFGNIYQIIAFADHPNVGELAKLQWKTMVEDMKKLALGLLVSELNEGPWKGKFEEKGYGDVVPHLVLWCICRGLISNGRNLLKSFLDNGGEIDAEHVMEAVISEEEYQKLAVVD